MKTAVSEAIRVHSGSGKPLLNTPPPASGPPATSGTLHCERSPGSMSADQRTEPKWEETEAVEVFEALARKITEVKALPISTRRPAAMTSSARNNKTNFMPRIPKPFF